ncbi:hypothetical protein SAMN05444420_102123 [Capnocytophaga granulosa]|uniref:Uncharacterized protein n=1 Tax=Capnocytophaga granulosa TaxID=45242 RepID=A0A1H2T8W2_9FLAO|nr:hypothetical protein SAMN05444420_102123 [Capnocytophaga granulosa]SUX15457.1 Uncharacterised protein [Capnocytophaga granulosa]
MDALKNITPKTHPYPLSSTHKRYEGIFFFNNTIAIFFV